MEAKGSLDTIASKDFHQLPFESTWCGIIKTHNTRSAQGINCKRKCHRNRSGSWRQDNAPSFHRWHVDSRLAISFIRLTPDTTSKYLCSFIFKFYFPLLGCLARVEYRSDNIQIPNETDSFIWIERAVFGSKELRNTWFGVRLGAGVARRRIFK